MNRFASPDSLAELDWVATRYGQRPCVIVGVDPLLEPKLAYDIDRAAAHAGVWKEAQLLQRLRSESPSQRKSQRADEPPTFNSREGLRGRIPVSNDPIPDWLEALFPEGPITKVKAS